jgi:raffinose/stachyose/melibiose transport system permease protein
MFGRQRFIHSLGFTFYYAFILLVVSTILGLILALMLNEKFRGQIILRAIYFFPAVLSLITVGLIWNEIFYRVFPAIGEFLGIELLSRSLLSSSKMAVYAVVLVNIWQFTGMTMILFLAGLQSIPEELYEASVMDGANYFQKFFTITLPFLMPIMQIVIVLGLKAGITVFDYIIALTGGGPAGATESIGILIYNLGFDENKFGYASAQAMVLFVIIVVISFIQIKVLSRLEVE